MKYSNETNFFKNVFLLYYFYYLKSVKYVLYKNSKSFKIISIMFDKK